MRYVEFSSIVTPIRMNIYLLACNGNTKQSMTLYRKNLLLTQEMFTVIGCFEIALRNSIDKNLINSLGKDWLRSAATNGDPFDSVKCRYTRESILSGIKKLKKYNHHKLVAELGFGFWRYMYAQNQYNATGRVLLGVFPSKPKSAASRQVNNKHIFNQLAKLNEIRNRMAHHEPICFTPGQAKIDTNYARQNYSILKQLFQWMQINEASLLYGLDHIISICDEIDKMGNSLKRT